MERRQGPYGKVLWVPPRKELALCLKAAGRYGMFWGKVGGVPAVCGAIRLCAKCMEIIGFYKGWFLRVTH